MISAKISAEDKVNVLLNGANDYITKPFSTEELLARIQVQLRIKEGRRENKILVYKDMVLDETNHAICIQEKQIHLTKTEFAILKQLL